MNTSKTKWNPEQYRLFEKERNLPFYDLIHLIQPQENMHIVDLGCGTGALTAILHQTFKNATTLGIDNSPEMLLESSNYQIDRLHFNEMSIDNFQPHHKYDLIFSNACLQWLPDHPQLLSRLASYLSPHGQFAFQLPAIFDYASHTIAQELAEDPLFKEAGAVGLKPNILTVEEYAQLLYRLGFEKQIVRLQVYGHLLPSTESVVEWVKGSLLTYYQGQLSPEMFQEFLKIYRQRILEKFGNLSPFFIPFKRILIWAQKKAE